MSIHFKWGLPNIMWKNWNKKGSSMIEAVIALAIVTTAILMIGLSSTLADHTLQKEKNVLMQYQQLLMDLRHYHEALDQLAKSEDEKEITEKIKKTQYKSIQLPTRPKEFIIQYEQERTYIQTIQTVLSQPQRIYAR